MNKILYLDKKSNEIENLLSGNKDIVIRAANIKKYPFKMIENEDIVYFINNNAEDVVLASATVSQAIFYQVNSELEMDELLSIYSDRAKLSRKKIDYIKKRKYVSIFVFKNIKSEYGTIDRSMYGVKENWIELKNKKR